MRAQLHGIVMTPAVSHGVEAAIAKAIYEVAPKFTPGKPLHVAPASDVLPSPEIRPA